MIIDFIILFIRVSRMIGRGFVGLMIEVKRRLWRRFCSWFIAVDWRSFGFFVLKKIKKERFKFIELCIRTFEKRFCFLLKQEVYMVEHEDYNVVSFDKKSVNNSESIIERSINWTNQLLSSTIERKRK